jgi:hypothetical protein
MRQIIPMPLLLVVLSGCAVSTPSSSSQLPRYSHKTATVEQLKIDLSVIRKHSKNVSEDQREEKLK